MDWIIAKECGRSICWFAELTGVKSNWQLDSSGVPQVDLWHKWCSSVPEEIRIPEF